MKTKACSAVLMLFFFGSVWAQDMSIDTKTAETLEKGDCFVLANEDFTYGLLCTGAEDVPAGMDTILGPKIYSFIPIRLNSDEDGLGQFLEGTISIRCLDIEGAQCGYYTFQALSRNDDINILLSDMEYLGALNFPSAHHIEMGGGGNISDADTFRELFDSLWDDAVLRDPEWKPYRLLDVMTLRKGLIYSSYVRD